MTNNFLISIYLDTRRAKQNGKFPVKLRVFTPQPRKQKLYPTAFEFSKSEFNSIWVATKPRNEFKVTRFQLQAIELKANEAAKNLQTFTFDQFEKKLYRNKGENDNIFYHYAEAIEKLKRNDQIGTAENYDLSKKSFTNFIEQQTGKTPGKLSFYEITPDWLNKYEKYMVNTLNRSRTTVSMYVRTLRTLFNAAISQKEIEPEIYPFGKSKYQIPSAKTVKKALSKDYMKLLFDSMPGIPEQQKAKAFWFFSYACNGMNIKDIANLRFKDIEGDRLTFYRAKTINTGKTDLKQVTVYLNEFTKSIIEQYGNKETSPENYIFPIVDHTTTPDKQHRQLKNFIRYINQHFVNFAKSIGIDESISTYWARHSFATTAIRNGASMEYVSEALSHSNLKTTVGYFAGFEDEKKREISSKLMEF